MNFKHILLIKTLFFVAFFTSASTSVRPNVNLSLESRDILESAMGIAPVADFKKDCKVRINHEMTDGGTVKGELIFEDVTWWQCSKMQVAAWWDRNF